MVDIVSLLLLLFKSILKQEDMDMESCIICKKEFGIFSGVSRPSSMTIEEAKKRNLSIHNICDFCLQKKIEEYDHSIEQIDFKNKFEKNTEELEFQKSLPDNVLNEYQYKIDTINDDKPSKSTLIISIITFFIILIIISNNTISNQGILIFFVISIALLIIKSINKSNSNKKLISKNNLKNELKENISNMNDIFINTEINNFKPTTKIYDNTNTYCIAIDEINHKFLIKYKKDTSYKIYNFTDLIECSIVLDGNQKEISGNIETVLLGAFLLGTTGAVIGASTKRKIEEFCESMYISITVNDYNNCIIKLPLINKKTNKISHEYKVAVEKANEIISALQIIKKATHKNMNISNDSIENIKKYKELLDLEIITPEEFAQKKKEILHL